MDVKTAVRTAKAYILDLFDEEKISDLGLEEVALDEASGNWLITLGFRRGNESNDDVMSAITAVLSKPRIYKIVTVSDSDDRVISVKNREVAT